MADNSSMNADILWQRVNKLIKEQNKTQRSLSLQCGFTERRIESLVSRNTLPDALEIYTIAKNLDVSVEWLATGKDPDGLSEDERELFSDWRVIDPAGQELIKSMIHAAAEKGKS
jgi:hypothetical protein